MAYLWQCDANGGGEQQRVPGKRIPLEKIRHSLVSHSLSSLSQNAEFVLKTSWILVGAVGAAPVGGGEGEELDCRIRRQESAKNKTGGPSRFRDFCSFPAHASSSTVVCQCSVSSLFNDHPLGDILREHTPVLKCYSQPSCPRIACVVAQNAWSAAAPASLQSASAR